MWVWKLNINERLRKVVLIEVLDCEGGAKESAENDAKHKGNRGYFSDVKP